MLLAGFDAWLVRSLGDRPTAEALIRHFGDADGTQLRFSGFVRRRRSRVRSAAVTP